MVDWSVSSVRKLRENFKPWSAFKQWNLSEHTLAVGPVQIGCWFTLRPYCMITALNVTQRGVIWQPLAPRFDLDWFFDVIVRSKPTTLRARRAIGGIYFTQEWRTETPQPALEFYIFEPWLESGIFNCILWLKVSFFSGDDWRSLKEWVKTCQMAPISPLHSPIFFLSSHLYSVVVTLKIDPPCIRSPR
jgi:hypothetical protein